MTYPTPETFNNLPWNDIQPYFDDLLARDLTPKSIDRWLRDWTRLAELLGERAARIRIATVQDTTDEVAEAAYNAFLADIFPSMARANQALIKKLVKSGLSAEGMEIAIKKMRVDAEIFREENIPLQTAERKNSTVFNKLIGAQTVEWEGEEYTITRLAPVYEDSDRVTREKMWMMIETREAQDREKINELWTEMMALRAKQAANAGFSGDYRTYRWQLLKRFDYSPSDCLTFHDAIEKVVVPIANRVYEKHRARLGGETIRPWDLDLYQGTFPVSSDKLRPFETEEDLLDGGARIFHKLDPVLGSYFDDMRGAGLIDFENRKGKGPGAFCSNYSAIKKPFIFGNAVGLPRDVITLLHECGHAFHNYETFALPYLAQRWGSMEFAEVASTAMELLGSPYLAKDEGGYYETEDAARARIKHLEKLILFWPYMAVVDAFQHWVYENHEAATDPANCDAAWAEQWERFIPSVDFSGFEDAKTRGWHRKRHIHRSPFYYIEYGVAQLGAVQIWNNALRDQRAALQSYRHALALGGTVNTPALYAAAGGKFAFDVETLSPAAELLETTLDELEASLA